MFTRLKLEQALDTSDIFLFRHVDGVMLVWEEKENSSIMESQMNNLRGMLGGRRNERLRNLSKIIKVVNINSMR